MDVTRCYEIYEEGYDSKEEEEMGLRRKFHIEEDRRRRSRHPGWKRIRKQEDKA